MRAWFVIIILIQPLNSASIANCLLAFQCANESTIANDTNNDGYKSHYGSLSTITGSQLVNCRGAFACAKASSISTDACRCHGSNSCSKISNLELSGTGQLIGKGVNALAYTTITAASNTVYCRGEQSCAYTQIEGASGVQGYGAYSLLNASIDSINGSGSINIYFYGYYAGFGATITCREGDTCTINCGSNGCVNLHLDCQNNCVLNPSLTDTTSYKNIPDILLYDSFQFETENDALCSAQSQTLKFDDYQERYKGEDIISDDANDGPICCSASESCFGLNNIKSTQETIVCSGRSSCEKSNIYTNGTVFCGGLGSCRLSTITTIGSVYCYGSNSCEFGDIIKASDVYCSTHHACYKTYISSNGSDLNIYLTGFQSGQDAHVLCHLGDECSLFCFGYNSCENLELECDGVCHVHCDDDTYCPNGWTPTSIENVSTNQPTATTTLLTFTSAHMHSSLNIQSATGIHSSEIPIQSTTTESGVKSQNHTKTRTSASLSMTETKTTTPNSTQDLSDSSTVRDRSTGAVSSTIVHIADTYGHTVTVTSVDMIYKTAFIILSAVFSVVFLILIMAVVYLCHNRIKSATQRFQGLNAQVNLDIIPQMETNDTKTHTQSHGDHINVVNVVDHRAEGVKIKKDQNKSIIYNMDPSEDTLVVGNNEETNFE